MAPITAEETQKVFEALNANECKAILRGGAAVAHYLEARVTEDIDLLVGAFPTDFRVDGRRYRPKSVKNADKPVRTFRPDGLPRTKIDMSVNLAEYMDELLMNHVEWDGDLAVASLPFLVADKIRTCRARIGNPNLEEKQLQDVTDIVGLTEMMTSEDVRMSTNLPFQPYTASDWDQVRIVVERQFGTDDAVELQARAESLGILDIVRE